MWEIDYLVATGRLRVEVSRLLDEFLATGDPDRAADLMVLIESAVAPVSGGLADDAGGVASAVVAGLPRMPADTRAEALLLLTQIVGSIEATEGLASDEARRLIESMFPMLAAMVEVGSDGDLAQGVDLISLCSSLSPACGERAAYYLGRIVERATGTLRESAERELAEVSRMITRGT
ncbi:hypothetical protein [Nocardioides luteus]|uniref:Uncharacterized protein n=1 Tax=Nocardioides luteus TaxID=1844 RepID=A0A1J4N8M9_9ACTN|nr:hypothetical protein [Nocardioides luteus]OIJ27008.1 hypothetical protein UG56_009520 [Nocardioides luteus]